MRKVLAPALTGVVALALTGTAVAGEETQTEEFGFFPKKLSAKKLTNVKFVNTITTFDDPVLGQPPSATRTVLDIPKQGRVNSDKVPACKTDEAGLNQAPTVAAAKQACGPGSQVSQDSGSSAIVRTNIPAPFDVINVDVVGFNEDGKRLYLYSKPTGNASAVAASVLVGQIKKFGAVDLDRPKGPYKESLDVRIPPLAAGAIAFFEVTIPKSKYVQARCKPKIAKAQATTVFANGAVRQSTDDFTTKCKVKKDKKGKKGKKK